MVPLPKFPNKIVSGSQAASSVASIGSGLLEQIAQVNFFLINVISQVKKTFFVPFSTTLDEFFVLKF